MNDTEAATPTFAQFWAAWPASEVHNRERAVEEFARLDTPGRADAINGVGPFLKELGRVQRRHADPVGYLRNRVWTMALGSRDEAEPAQFLTREEIKADENAAAVKPPLVMQSLGIPITWGVGAQLGRTLTVLYEKGVVDIIAGRVRPGRKRHKVVLSMPPEAARTLIQHLREAIAGAEEISRNRRPAGDQAESPSR